MSEIQDLQCTTLHSKDRNSSLYQEEWPSQVFSCELKLTQFFSCPADCDFISYLSVKAIARALGSSAAKAIQVIRGSENETLLFSSAYFVLYLNFENVQVKFLRL